MNYYTIFKIVVAILIISMVFVALFPWLAAMIFKLIVFALICMVIGWVFAKI